MPGTVDLFDSGPAPARGVRWWRARPRRWRRVAIAAAVVLLLIAGAVGLRARDADRRLAERVRLDAVLRVGVSSTSPPGGAVRYSVAVRNDGARPLTVRSVTGSTDRLRLRAAGDRRLFPGRVADIPLSVRLTCGTPAAAGGTVVSAEVRVRRDDGTVLSRRVALRSTGPLLDVVATLCAVRPGLRDAELSGPVVPGAGAG